MFDLAGPILSSFYFCLSTVVAIHDLSRQVVMTFGELGESSIRIPLPIDCLISYCRFTYVCPVCVKQNDDVIVYRTIGRLIIPNTEIRRRKPRKDRQCYDRQKKKGEKDELWTMKHNTEY